MSCALPVRGGWHSPQTHTMRTMHPVMTACPQPLPSLADCAPAPAPVPAIDRETFAQLELLDPHGVHDAVRRVMLAYERSLIKSMHDMQSASERQDLVAIGRLSHTLRSSSASVGALVLSSLCKQLEQRARDEPLDKLLPLLQALQIESERVKADLAGMLVAKGFVP